MKANLAEQLNASMRDGEHSTPGGAQTDIQHSAPGDMTAGTDAPLHGEGGDSQSSSLRFKKAFWGAIGRTFRGEIWENAAQVPMGRGFANDGKPFDINTACYLKPIQRAIRERPYGKFVTLAAVQMLKTFGAIESPAAYFIQHAPGDMTIYIGAEGNSFDQSKARLMPWIKSIPGIKEQIDAAEAANRFDITTTEFYLPGMVLRVWPLNESTTQRITLRYVLISDAFLSKRTGMVQQAIRRKTQHDTTTLKDYKVIIESQGGEENDDFDQEYKSTDQGILHVVCPCCGEGQPFEWHRERPEDFRATLTREKIREIKEAVMKRFETEETRILTGGNGENGELQERRPLLGGTEHSTAHIQHSTPKAAEVIDESIHESMESQRRNPFSAVNHAIGFEIAFAERELAEALRRPERRHAGMKRGDEALIRLPNGEYNESEVMRLTYYECYHCGSAWHDTPATRRILDESSYYVPSNPTALWENVGFWFPSWAGQRLAWGGEFNMLGFLRAEKIFKETGNVEPLRQWYQKSAARPWSMEIAKNRDLELAVGSYETDPAKLMPDFHSRNMTVDAQKKLDAAANEDVVGSFWFEVCDFDKFGNQQQRARGFVDSWEKLIAIQKFWKVPNQRFCIDASKWGPQIEAMAALNCELVTPAIPHPITGRRDPYPSCWRLFYGDKRAEFKVEVAQGDGRVVTGRKTVSRAWSEGQPSRLYTAEINGAKYRFFIFRYRWSNIAFEMQLDAILAKTAGMVRFEALPREALVGIDGKPDVLTLAKEAGKLTYEQQLSARYLTRVRGVNKYEDIANREAHYRDCRLMQLVRASQDGLLGHVAATATEISATADGHG